MQEEWKIKRKDKNMVNKHTGRRLNHHTGKEILPKYEYQMPKHKKVNKKYKCRICGKRLPGKTMVECEPDKHGRLFYCFKCYTGKSMKGNGEINDL